MSTLINSQMDSQMDSLKARASLYCLFIYFFSLTVSDLNITINKVSIDLRVVIISIAGFLHLLQHKESAKVDNNLLITIYIFVFFTGISIFLSVNLKASLVSASYIIQWLVVFMVINESIKTKEDFYTIYNFFILYIFTIAVRLLYTAFSDVNNGISLISNDWIDHVSIPIFLVPNDIVLLAIVLPFILCNFFISKPKIAKGVWFILLIITFIPSLVYLSRTAVIATVLSFVFFLGSIFSLRKVFFFLLITLFLIVVFDYFNSFKMLDKFNAFLYPRLSLWWISLNMFSEAKFFGQGPHTFQYFANQNYIISTGMPEFLSSQFLTIKILKGVTWAHNIYLELLSERGLLSLIGFVVMIFMASKNLFTFINQTLDREDRLVAISLSSSLIVFLFAGLVDLTFTHFWVGLILFSLLAFVLKVHCLNNKME